MDVPLLPVSGSADKGKSPMKCSHCDKWGHNETNCWTKNPSKKGPAKGPGKSHWPKGRKGGESGGQSALNAQLSELQQKHDAERAVTKEISRDNKELSQENDVLKARLTVAEQAVDAVRNRHSALVDTWARAQILRYRERGVRWSDFDSQVWAFKIWLAMFMSVWSGSWYFGTWLPTFLWTILVYLTLWILPVLEGYSIYSDAVGFYRGTGNGGIFRSIVTWEYRFIRTFEHVHTDDRPDNNALQNIKHTPRYAEFLLRKGISWGWGLICAIEHQEVIVSLELYTQICNPKNLDPFLSPTEARSAFQRSAAHNHSVSIDRNLILRGSYVYQETVCLAFFAYLALRESWKKRDFLPALPK